MINRVFLLLAPFVGLTASSFGQYAITTSSLPVAKVGQSYIAGIQTNSAATATSCNILSGALPAGLAMFANGTGCSISGTPTIAATASFTLSISNNQSETTAARTFSLAVFGITTPTVPPANVNFLYSFQFQANGGSNYQWSLLSGSLPIGLSLASTGLLYGTPLTAGQFPFAIRVFDPGTGLTDSRNYSLTVSNTGGGQFQIIPSSLPNGTVNQSYSAIVQTTGGSGNLSLANGCVVIGGSLPPGISVAPSGALCIFSGVPLNQGVYQFQLQAIDSQGPATPALSFSITVGGAGSGTGGLAITTGFVPNGTTALPYLPNGNIFFFTASGGTGIYSWSVDSGSLPSGLTLNANGTLTGTPTQSGTFNFVVRVVSSGLLTSFQQTTTRSYAMTISSGGLTIVETSLPLVTTGQPYSFQLHASGGVAPYHWRLGSTNLQGLTIDFNTGLISGTALSNGSFAFPITVSDNAGAQATVNFTVTASGPFSILTSSLPDGTAGAGYSQGLQAAGGQSPYTWAIASGNLPPGLALTQSGSINGTPTQNGQFTFTVTATDVAGRTTSKILMIQVGGAGPVQILTSSLPNGSVGAQYSQTLTASGGQSPYTWSIVVGSLPAGLNLNSAGTIQGTPAQGGSFAFAVQAADAIGNSTAKSFTMSISSTGLVLSPNQLSFSYIIGGSLPVAQQVNVTSNVSQGFNTATTAPWLTVNPPTATTPAVLTISVNPAGLSVGTYSANVTVTPAGGSDPQQILPVSLTVTTQSGLTVTPSVLAFTFQSGGAIPSAQSLFIGSSTGALSFTSASSGGGWLSVSPSSGITPAVVSVSVSPVGLNPGTYYGIITIFGGGVSRQIPVTLTVVTQVIPIVTLSKSSLAFDYQFGGGLPPTQTVTLTGTAGVSFSASSASPWLSVRPDVGTTPANLFVSVNPTGLSPATYNGAVTITTTAANGNTTLTLPVTFRLTAAGFPVVTTVVNAASYATGAIAAGEIVTLGGLSLGPDTPVMLALDQSGKVSTTLGGVQVLFNGYPAPLTYVGASQINAVVPYEIAGQLNVLVAVKSQGLTSVAFPLTQAGSAPGLFTLNASGTGPGAILNQDNSVNSPLNPASKGSFVALYVTGEGQTTPAGVTGKVTTVSQIPPITPQPVLPVTVTIGGQTVTPSFVGEAPGFVSGVMQLNVQIPLNVGSGDLPIDVSVGGNLSQSGVTVSVQ